MAYQVVRVEFRPVVLPLGGDSRPDRQDDSDWQLTVEPQTTDQVVVQKVAHLGRAGWEHVATTPDSLKDPRSGGLLLVFWRADPGVETPARRVPGDRAWVRDYPSSPPAPVAVPVAVGDIEDGPSAGSVSAPQPVG